MKYLNKIIFINSANIPYAEISVDGNVHFTGTQGVGKRTIISQQVSRTRFMAVYRCALSAGMVY